MTNAEAAAARAAVERLLLETPPGHSVFIEDLEPILGRHTVTTGSGMLQRVMLDLAERGIVFRRNPGPPSAVARQLGGGPVRASYTRLPDRLAPGPSLQGSDIRSILGTTAPENPAGRRIQPRWEDVALGAVAGFGGALLLWMLGVWVLWRAGR